MVVIVIQSKNKCFILIEQKHNTSTFTEDDSNQTFSLEKLKFWAFNFKFKKKVLKSSMDYEK